MFKQPNTEENAYQSLLCLYKRRRTKKGGKSQGTPSYAWLIGILLYSFSSFSQSHIRKKHEISGSISPKSIVSSGTGLFAAQNMMYRHSITIYDKSGKLLAKINDGINLANYGFNEYNSGKYMGAPVEAEFTNDGNFLWVSNYNMFGEGFKHPGCDACNGSTYDPGFLYKINTSTFKIENVVKVGAVPKYLAINEQETVMLVSNWTSGDVSIIDLEKEEEIQKIYVGSHPRGIAITKDSKKAYVAIMGSTKIAELDLVSYDVSYINNIGRAPRHLILSENDSLLYVAVNSSNTVVKYHISSGDKQVCKTNSGPRTMILSPNQQFLYIVNYFSNTFSKIETDSMSVVEVVETGNHPIGITANWDDSEIWVACYTGKIEVFKDFNLAKINEESNSNWGVDLADFFPYFNVSENYVSENVPEPIDSSKLSIQEDEIEISEIDTDTSTYVIDPLIIKEEPEKKLIQPKVHAGTLDSPELTARHIRNKENDASCTFHIIVGSFSVYENAVNFTEEMVSKGYPAQMLETNKGVTYVSVQCFSSREKASENLSSVYDNVAVKGWIFKK